MRVLVEIPLFAEEVQASRGRVLHIKDKQENILILHSQIIPFGGIKIDSAQINATLLPPLGRLRDSRHLSVCEENNSKSHERI